MALNSCLSAFFFSSSPEGISLISVHWCTFFFSRNQGLRLQKIYLQILILTFQIFIFSFAQTLNAYLQEVPTSFTDKSLHKQKNVKQLFSQKVSLFYIMNNEENGQRNHMIPFFSDSWYFPASLFLATTKLILWQTTILESFSAC